MGGVAVLLLALQTATPGSLTFDVQCMVALGQMTETADQSARAAASTASQFYFGRIDGRVPDGRLEAALVRETHGMPEQPSPALPQACGNFMAGRGQRLSEVGRRMSEREAQPARR